jgi:GT2 family glycosyltransferase
LNSKALRISIIILNWNGKKDTLECLESVQQIDYPNYQIVVVDNGSIDGSVSAIRESFSHIHIIENQANLGFAAGNNVGIEYAVSEGADYIFLLNNDTTVDSQLLREFIKASEKYPDAGILGAQIYIYKDPKKIWYAGAKWLPEQAQFIHLGIGEVDSGENWQEIRETEYICGCALLIKTEVVKKIGVLDPRYFLIWEETDWCYRARQAGYRCLVVPNAKVWHKISASFSGGNQSHHAQYFWWRNRFLWIEKNINFPASLKLYWVILKEIRRQIRRYLNSSTTQQERLRIKAAWQGINDYIFRRFGDCPDWVRSPSK